MEEIAPFANHKSELFVSRWENCVDDVCLIGQTDYMGMKKKSLSNFNLFFFFSLCH